MRSLSSEQKKSFIKYVSDYLGWNETNEGKENLKDHRKHCKFFQDNLSKNTIPQMTPRLFSEVYKGLWASNIWGNKDWYVENKLIKPNGNVEHIKEEFIKLFYDENLSMAERYNHFKKNIKGLGSSALTELLHFVFPDKYCLWNDKPKTVLPFLGLDSLLPEKVFKYQITDGNDYTACNEVMNLLREELIKSGLETADFIDLDCYLWFIFSQIMSKADKTPSTVTKEKRQPSAEKELLKIETHEDAESFLLKLGGILGYSTYTCDKNKKANSTALGEIAILTDLPAFAGERDLNSARTIDVIWFDEDENPKYCFEVEHTMDILRSLTRLNQLRHFHINFFVVSPEDKRSKFDIETSKIPFRNEKDRFHFISYDELIELYEGAQSFFKLRNKLFGN